MSRVSYSSRVFNTRQGSETDGFIEAGSQIKAGSPIQAGGLSNVLIEAGGFYWQFYGNHITN